MSVDLSKYAVSTKEEGFVSLVYGYAEKAKLYNNESPLERIVRLDGWSYARIIGFMGLGKAFCETGFTVISVKEARKILGLDTMKSSEAIEYVKNLVKVIPHFNEVDFREESLIIKGNFGPLSIQYNTDFNGKIMQVTLGRNYDGVILTKIGEEIYLVKYNQEAVKLQKDKDYIKIGDDYYYVKED